MNDNEERIRQKAYEIWVEEGRPHGRAEEHWTKARNLVEKESGPAAVEGVPEKPPRRSGTRKAAAKAEPAGGEAKTPRAKAAASGNGAEAPAKPKTTSTRRKTTARSG